MLDDGDAPGEMAVRRFRNRSRIRAESENELLIGAAQRNPGSSIVAPRGKR